MEKEKQINEVFEIKLKIIYEDIKDFSVGFLPMPNKVKRIIEIDGLEVYSEKLNFRDYIHSKGNHLLNEFEEFAPMLRHKINSRKNSSSNRGYFRGYFKRIFRKIFK